MRTPITYYGGKQSMINIILPKLYKNRKSYIEPFFGGGAVFFAKDKERIEVINDHNDFVINFYEVMKSDFEALNSMIQGSLYSEALHRKASLIYCNNSVYDKVTRAWAFWYLLRTSFNSELDTCFSYNVHYPKRQNMMKNRKDEFIELQDRLENTCIMSREAIDVIKTFDNEGAFFYLDPPYVNANQGHYKGYTQEEFNKLLEVLVNIKGKFLLSSYDNDKLEEYIKQCGWNMYKKEMCKRTTTFEYNKKKGKKVECLTYNYKTE